jgi:hypothetical protein
MVGYKIEDLIELFRASDSLSTDGYKQICDSLTGVKYVKRDHLYRSGVWRKNEVRSFVYYFAPLEFAQSSALIALPFSG